MPYCEFCDVELLPDTHYCSRCGQARAIHRSRGIISTGHASQFGIPHVNAALGRSETPRPITERQEEEQQRQNVFLPYGSQPATGTVPGTQGMPQLRGMPTVSGIPPSVFNAPTLMPRTYSPGSSPSPTHFVPSGLTTPVTPFPPLISQQPQLPQHPYPSPPHHPHPPYPHLHRTPSGKLHDDPLRRQATSVPKWLLIVVILLIIAIGGGGVLAAMLHLPILRFGGNANTSSSHIQSTTGNGGTNLQFSGALKNAMMTALTYNGCSGGSAFVFQVQGSIDGTAYALSISISGSTGTRSTAEPGTYTSKAFVNLHQSSKPIAAPWMWEAGLGVGQEAIVVNPGGASGTVLAVMPAYKGGSGGTVTVSGNWTCNSITVPGGNGGGGGG